MMLDIKEFLAEHRLDSITYTYTQYGIIIVTCILKPSYYKDVPVYGCAGTEDEAREQALSILRKVRELNLKLEIPKIDMNHGNKHVVVKQENGVNTIVSFMNNDGLIAVTGISLKNDAGFHIHENPEPADLKIYKPVVKDYHGDDEVVLNAGEKLYSWDTCRGLSGSFGFAVLDSQNRIVRSKMIGIS